jgi:hypothetical protein
MKDEKGKKMRVLLRFTNKKVVSLVIKEHMTVKSFKNFLSFAYKEEMKNSQFKLYYGAKLVDEDTLLMATFNNEDLNAFIISLSPLERKESMTKDWKDEHDKMELYVYSSYRDTMKANSVFQSEREMISKFPIMHKTLQNRIKTINEKNKLDFLNLDPDNIENYSLRDYLKIEVIFKLFLFYILFGSHTKGFNIPLFISILIIYYWYCVYSDLNTHYDKKMKELELSPEELKEIKHLDMEEDEESENENVDQGGKKILKIGEEINEDKINHSPSKDEVENLKNKIKEHQNEIDIKGQRLVNENENNQNVKTDMDDILIEVRIKFIIT